MNDLTNATLHRTSISGVLNEEYKSSEHVFFIDFLPVEIYMAKGKMKFALI